MAADFSGWATKAGLECSDGLTIMPDAFKHQDKQRVPLVWKHEHSDVENILGHAILENRPGQGVYCEAFFNDSSKAKSAKIAVEHGDLNMLSIWANKLNKRGTMVHGGMIREVSLVMAGANPGAVIDFVNIKHEWGVETLDDEAIITTGIPIEIMHGDSSDDADGEVEETVEHAADGEETLQEVYDSLTPKQKDVVNYMIGVAAEGSSAAHSDTEDSDDGDAESADDEENDTDDSDAGSEDADNEGDLNHQEGNADMGRNVFDETKQDQIGAGGVATRERIYLEHEDVKGILQDAMKKGSLKEAVESYAISHGIDDIEVLFPDAKLTSASPDFDKRRTEWVKGVLDMARKVPFARIKNLVADITQDQARARGYIKGSMKKEEWFGVSGRSTTPTTVYKKQSLDRDDIIDITDFDIIAWLKGEMRIMLEEELARAILIGDGRDVGSEDKIKDPAAAAEGAGIRSILNDHELYAATITVNVDDASSSPSEIVDGIVLGMGMYKGSGNPVLYTTLPQLTKILMQRDTLGRRLYRTKADVAAEMGVSDIVTVEVMEEVADLVGIIVNLADYTIGADRGGDVTTFEDFDIDYNKNKYLIETRVSGALTKIRSAVIVKKTAAANVLVAPNAPTFVESTGVVTIPTQTGVVYKNKDTSATLTAGAQSALAAGATLNVLAVPASGYYFADNMHDEWAFTRPAA